MMIQNIIFEPVMNVIMPDNLGGRNIVNSNAEENQMNYSSMTDKFKQSAIITADNLKDWYEKNKMVFWGTYAVALIAYSYLLPQ
jgi:hypothetical protein